MTKILISAGILLMTFCCQLNGQVTQDNNNPVVGNFVGFNVSSFIPLPIANIGDPRINITSNGNNKFAITELPTWNGLNGLTRTDVQRTTLGLQGETNIAWSMLHLWSGFLTGSMQRDWMNVGTSYTANQDFMYTGLLERPITGESNLITDAVIAWGCQDGTVAPDNFRILFVQPTPVSTPAGSEQGLETFRITPQGNVGVGDFSSMPTGLNEQPTQRLDVDGTARLRQMPGESPNVLITGVEQDEDPVAGDYILNYLAFSGSSSEFLAGDGTWVDGSGTLCDWNIVNAGADVAMGYGTACISRAAGIGTNTPLSKLEVNFNGTLPEGFNDYAVNAIANTANDGNSMERIAVRGEARNDTEEQIFQQYGGYFSGYGGRHTYGVYAKSLRSPVWNANTAHFGLFGEASDPSGGGQNIGVNGEAYNAHLNIGARGYANYDIGMGGPQPLYNYGVQGHACNALRNIGVYGSISQGCTGVAGYFNGDLQYTGSLIPPSDEMLKTNVEEIESGLNLVIQLSPKSYNFKTEEYSHMNLPDGLQFGLIAQEVQEIIPNLTKTAVTPAQLDEEGSEISPETEYLGVDYMGMIPILISAVKEQQAQISDQAQTIDDLQESLNNQNDLIAQMMDQMDQLSQQVNNCCEGGFKFNPSEEEHGQQMEKDAKSENVLNQNTPNPFRSQTTISYSLETGGKVLLNVYNKAGKILTTLEESEQQAGTYRYEWDASGLPAGLYHYALYVDGELLVKKAIKLAD